METHLVTCCEEEVWVSLALFTGVSNSSWLRSEAASGRIEAALLDPTMVRQRLATRPVLLTSVVFVCLDSEPIPRSSSCEQGSGINRAEPNENKKHLLRNHLQPLTLNQCMFQYNLPLAVCIPFIPGCATFPVPFLPYSHVPYFPFFHDLPHPTPLYHNMCRWPAHSSLLV